MHKLRACALHAIFIGASMMALWQQAGAETTLPFGSPLNSPVVIPVGVTAPPAVAAAPTVAFAAAQFSAVASAGAALISINRYGDASSSVSVTYTTSDGTAVAGTDYTATAGTVAWAAGDTTPKSFPVPIATTVAGNNSFMVVLTSSSGANLAAPFDASVAITAAAAASTGSPVIATGPAFYVSPSGNDGNAGSVSAPFKTLTMARSAMRASSTKITFVRAGIYSVSSTLALTTADDGETWQYYPSDGVNSAVLDGGNSVSGGVIAIEGGSNITINGLKIQHFVDYGILGDGGPNTNWGTVAEDTGNAVENCDVGFNTITSWSSAGISLSGPNATITNNYVHDVGSQGIASYAYYAGKSINGTVVENNVVLRAVQRRSDGGAIYINMHSGIQSDYVTVTNNYVADQGSANTWGVHGIYLDDDTSNATVTGNVVGPPSIGTGTGSGSQWGTNAISAFIDNSGNHNAITGNLVDLGSSGAVTTALFAYDKAETADVGMDGDSFTGNIVISNFTGRLTANSTGLTGHAYFQNTPALGIDPKGASYVIRDNVYWNYAAGGSVFSNGTVTGDSAPINEDPQVSGWDYAIASGSAVYNAPVSFAPIPGGWGPPGFVIPQTGAPPSAPH